MHESAMEAARKFFDKYKPTSVLEVGSLEVCGGQMRDVAPPGCYYIGIDMREGPGVDRLMEDPYTIPDYGSFDAVVSTSTFEHAEFFWLLFREMVKTVAVGGHVYVNAPSNGPYHRHPVDCWRFYPDAGPALAKWATYLGYPVEVVETEIGAPDTDGGWEDWICVWRRVR